MLKLTPHHSAPTLAHFQPPEITLWMYLSSCIPVCLHACMPACLYVCPSVFAYASTPVCLHACMSLGSGLLVRGAVSAANLGMAVFVVRDARCARQASGNAWTEHIPVSQGRFLPPPGIETVRLTSCNLALRELVGEDLVNAFRAVRGKHDQRARVREP